MAAAASTITAKIGRFSRQLMWACSKRLTSAGSSTSLPRVQASAGRPLSTMAMPRHAKITSTINRVHAVNPIKACIDDMTSSSLCDESVAPTCCECLVAEAADALVQAGQGQREHAVLAQQLQRRLDRGRVLPALLAFRVEPDGAREGIGEALEPHRAGLL